MGIAVQAGPVDETAELERRLQASEQRSAAAREALHYRRGSERQGSEGQGPERQGLPLSERKESIVAPVPAAARPQSDAGAEKKVSISSRPSARDIDLERTTAMVPIVRRRGPGRATLVIAAIVILGLALVVGLVLRFAAADGR